jgi:hypothetical protein
MMKKVISRLVKLVNEEKGTVLVLVAAALTVILGMTALVVDVGALAIEKTRLKNACDAAALAAAHELPDTILAKQRALEYLGLNHVDAEHAIITFSHDDIKITVEAAKTIDYYFAPVLGLNTGIVTARSTAAYGSVSGMTGVVPFGIPDQPMTFGVEYKLKAGSQDDYGPGNYGPLALELSGAASYLNNLKQGYSGVISVGDWIDTEPGNMSGPTMDGVSYRLNQCPHIPQCSIESYHSDCAKVMIVPIFDPTELAGRDQVQIVGFAAFLLKGVEGSGNESQVIGHFLEIVPPEGLKFDLDPDQADYGLRTARLIDD